MASADEASRPAVVVPGTPNGSSVACVRSLSGDYRCIALVEHPHVPVAHSRYCDEVRVVPSAETEPDSYLDALRKVVAREDVLTVLPTRERDVYLLATHREELADNVATPWPTAAQFRTVSDRRTLLDVADDLEVPIPETRLLTAWTDWSEPTVVKSRYSVLDADDGLVYPGVRQIAPADPPDVDRVVEEMGHEPIVQRFVPDGGEYGFFAHYKNGEPVATFQHHRLRSDDFAGGASSHREAVRIPELADLGRRVLDHLDWEGPAMVEFRRDAETGAFKLMEVNPRFWGSLPLAVHAGVDFPRTFVRHAAGAPPVDWHPYDKGVTSTLLPHDLLFLRSLARRDYPAHVEKPPVARAVKDTVASWFDTNFDLLSTNDPAPFGAWWLHTLGKLRRRLR